MKKLLLTSVVAIATLNIYGQGTVTFANGPTAQVTNQLTGARVPQGTAFRVALYYLPDSATAPTTADFDVNGIMLGANSGFNVPGGGQWNAGTRTAPTSPAGGAGWFQVRAWEFAFGDTYQAALANPVPQGGRLALVGTSNIIKVNLGNPTTTPPGTAGSLVGSGMQGFFVAPVPEPTTIGLGLLGLGALLALRRRK
jgi:MYXO-CTERM domain-containing protein